jgi:lipopolysaccharide/colanic/teichoic acid biosynthesis glycosyltransferase
MINKKKVRLHIKKNNEFFQYKYVKRILDFIFALLATISLFSIVFIIISIIILITNRYRPLFKQQRTGHKGISFYIYKFRTMSNNSEHKIEEIIGKGTNGFLQIENDCRVTKVGRFLRKTSIDELPQLINILKGEMSFIGPRPLVYEDVKKLSGKHLQRYYAKPGITGYAQVNGRSIASLAKREINDLYYIDNISFSLDTKIFFKTIIVLFKKDMVF